MLAPASSLLKCLQQQELAQAKSGAKNSIWILHMVVRNPSGPLFPAFQICLQEADLKQNGWDLNQALRH